MQPGGRTRCALLDTAAQIERHVEAQFLASQPPGA
jgi:hypothetical protein